MPNDLIWYPDIFALGQTEFNTQEFDDWLKLNDLTPTPLDASPIANLWRDVTQEDSLERMVEFGGRHCYRAWNIGRDRADYIKNIIDMDHGSVLEHATINWAVQGVSRSLSLELARHRVGIALSQESQRYVDAADVQFVVPPIISFLAGGSMTNAQVIRDFHRENITALEHYKTLQEEIIARVNIVAPNVKSLTMLKKRANEAARAHLPNCTETRFLWTTNMRILRHFLWLRGGSGADLEIRRMACHMLHIAKAKAPSIFADMTTRELPGIEGYGVPVIVSSDD